MEREDEDLISDFHRQTSQALSELRKESLDVYNRIHSIVEDVKFVNEVHAAYPQLPILRKGLLVNGSVCADCRTVFQRTYAAAPGMSTLLL